MAVVRDYRNLIAWQKAHELTLDVYRLTGRFPQAERFGLSEQLRKASSSIGANIAEGCGRSSKPDLVRFLSIASGSASEVQYHLQLSRDLGYLDNESFQVSDQLAHEVKRLLYGLISTTGKSKD